MDYGMEMEWTTFSTPWTKILASSKSCMHVKRQSVVCVLLLLLFFWGKDHRARKLITAKFIWYTLSVCMLAHTTLENQSFWPCGFAGEW